MFAITAIGWAVTFIISLAYVFLNFENKMLLLEDKSESCTTSKTCGFKGLETVLSIIQSPIKSATSFYEVTRERTRDIYYSIINSDIIHSELMQTGKHLVVHLVNYSILLVSRCQTLDITFKRIILSIVFSCCLLYILLSCIEMNLAGVQHYETSGELSEISNGDSVGLERAKRNRSKVVPVSHHQAQDQNTPEHVTAVISVYDKVFRVLEESNFYTKQQHNMTAFTVTEVPQLSDVLTMLDPLFVALHEGVENLAILSQEYMKQNSQLRAAEDTLNNSEFKNVNTENEEELMLLVSEKDAEIAELTDRVETLMKEIDGFVDKTSEIYSEMTTLSGQLENQKRRADKAIKVYNVAMKEEEDVQQSIEDELKAERDLNEAVIEDYSRNLQTVLKILMQLSKSGEPTFVSIEDFLLSDTFGDYLKLGDYPAELEADKLFQDYTDRADTYTQHLRILKRKY